MPAAGAVDFRRASGALAASTVLVAVLSSAGTVAVASMAGCASEEIVDEDPAASGETADAILGGAVERGYPAVGMLRFKSGAFGTGALIAPNVVLTAGHVAIGPPTEFYYGSPEGSKEPTPANLRSVPVAEFLLHPCYQAPTGDDCPRGGDPIDVAVVRLAKPITDVALLAVVDGPLDYFWGLLSPYERDSCVAVGFGFFLDADGKASAGVRRSARSKVDSVDASELVTVRETGIATSGDSGGPLLCNRKIIGTVRGRTGAATPGSPYDRKKEGYERTDLWRRWIADYVKKASTKT